MNDVPIKTIQRTFTMPYETFVYLKDYQAHIKTTRGFKVDNSQVFNMILDEFMADNPVPHVEHYHDRPLLERHLSQLANASKGAGARHGYR